MPEGWWEYMTKEEEPNPGPERDTVYVPGTPGGQWTNEEVDATRSLTFSFSLFSSFSSPSSTRMRVFQMIHPDFDVKKAQGTWNGFGSTTEIGQTTENTLMRLVFHDCMRYQVLHLLGFPCLVFSFLLTLSLLRLMLFINMTRTGPVAATVASTSRASVTLVRVRTKRKTTTDFRQSMKRTTTGWTRLR